MENINTDVRVQRVNIDDYQLNSKIHEATCYALMCFNP